MLNIIDQIVDFGVRSITFTGGGEPLTNKNIDDAIEYASDVGLNIGLVTNGGLLNNEINQSVNHCCRFIRVSIDAGTVETHHKLHGTKNKFELNKIGKKVIIE